MPKASVLYDKSGRLQYGLPEAPTRQSLQYAFEMTKAAENVAAADRRMQVPSGRRTAAKSHLEHRWAQESQQPEEPPRRQLVPGRHLVCSADNTLPGVALQEVEQARPYTASKRVYCPGELPPAQRDHLGPGMVPLPGTSHLGIGDPRVTHGHGHQERDDLGEDKVPTAGRSAGGGEGGAGREGPGGGLVVVGDGSEWWLPAKVAEVRALQQRLCEEYPHGVPKLVQLQLQEQGLLPPESLPSLPFAATLG